MATLAQQFTGLRCPPISHTRLSRRKSITQIQQKLLNSRKNKTIVSAVAISNAETREREELKQLFEEAYERCRTAPMEGVSFTLEEFHSALENYDFNSELGTKVSAILFLSFSFSILVFSLFLKI